VGFLNLKHKHHHRRRHRHHHHYHHQSINHHHQLQWAQRQLASDAAFTFTNKHAVGNIQVILSRSASAVVLVNITFDCSNICRRTPNIIEQFVIWKQVAQNDYAVGRNRPAVLRLGAVWGVKGAESSQCTPDVAANWSL